MSWVAVLMGSESDWPVMQSTTSMLKTLGVQYEVRVTSAHRTPAGTQAYVTDAEERGCRVFVCAAGMAAHLAGAVAAHTQRPVIGVPIDSGPLQGF
ncbi:MAG: AIR carboxylase family protein, partial [Pseudomonadota bacterium]|nr:AIR carboxylase family protein [Pseudomonadota bacterium]